MSTESILKEFIEKSDNHFITNLPCGTTTSIKDFYENVVLINSPEVEIVKQWHRLLMQYIKDDDAIFFVRRYASAPNKNWTKIRRGFLTEYDCGLKYVFCDNYFAHYFFMMAMKGIVPSYVEFKSLILKRELPYGFMVTSQEKPFQAFKKGKAVNINKAGWKLDHIYSVNENYNFNYSSEKKEIFPIGEQSDWVRTEDNTYFSRKMNSSSIQNHKEKVIAHFLRLVHPMNYFLTPQKKRSTFDVGGSNEMIDFVRGKNKEKYGLLFDEFEKMIFVECNNVKSKAFPEIINFGFKQLQEIKINVKKKSSNLKIHKTDFVRNIEVDINIIKGYLVDGKSYRKIEKDFMQIDSQNRGGGFVAKKILNSYGIMGEHKGIITNFNIDLEIEKSYGILKETLRTLKLRFKII